MYGYETFSFDSQQFWYELCWHPQTYRVLENRKE